MAGSKVAQSARAIHPASSDKEARITYVHGRCAFHACVGLHVYREVPFPARRVVVWDMADRACVEPFDEHLESAHSHSTLWREEAMSSRRRNRQPGCNCRSNPVRAHGHHYTAYFLRHKDGTYSLQ